MPFIAWLVFVGAAILEVAGDAVIRRGLRGSAIALVAVGCAMLGCYGVVVNQVQWDFSRLLGVYVAVFAAVSVLCGRFVFGEQVPPSTWIGLAIIVAGGLVIQLGSGQPPSPPASARSVDDHDLQLVIARPDVDADVPPSADQQ